MELNATKFAEFFHGVHCGRTAHGTGCVKPFEWQERLATRVLDDTGGDDAWPEVIDVPTGMGKTAVVDVAVFALAAQAARPPARRTAPTRTFVVVNRRVVVDQTHEHALHLKRRLEESLEGGRQGVLPEVAHRLLSLSVGASPPVPLAVVRMHGGVTWSWRWLASPAQPAVVTGTVDQFGSRLLFRGYGVGDRLRPIDAALTGTDRLLILDEAHLAWPFVRTAMIVDASECRAAEPLLARRRPRPVLLSATPPLGRHAPHEVFRLDPSAETSPAALERLGTSRNLRLVDLKSSKAQSEDHLARALAAVALGADLDARRIAVVCNTVALARRTFEHLSQAATTEAAGTAADGAERDVWLVIGRCRELERSRIAADVLQSRLAPGERSADERRLIVVATQTVEVGADIDVDALITEAAPIDALLQRLGRLDRRGARGSSQAVVMHTTHRHDGAEAPVYGEATQRTWDWLVGLAGQPRPAGLGTLLAAMVDAPTVDLGPVALRTLLDPATRSSLATEPPAAPVALAPLLERWARTQPRPDPDQEVGPFLHGIDHGPPEVQVCWRAGLPEPDSSMLAIWEEELRTAPVSGHETMSLPLPELRRFLAAAPSVAGADVEGRAEPDDEPSTVRVPAVVQSPDGTVRLIGNVDGVRPGATVVLRSESGGHDSWGWTGARPTGERPKAVPDVADLLPVGGRGRPLAGGTRLRLRRAVLESLLGRDAEISTLPGLEEPDPDPGAAISVLERAAAKAAATSPGSISSWYADRLLEACARARSATQTGLALVADPLDHGAPWRGRGDRGDRAWWLLRSRRGLPADAGGATEDDETVASSAGGQRIGLDQHLCDVQERCRLVARRLGLSDGLEGALALAGLAHDLGKADPRFQAMLYGGSPERAEATGRLLAKSGMDPADLRAYRDAARRARLPARTRHEALSAALLAALLERDRTIGAGLDADLVHHLVASHHGYSRPLLPGVVDPEPRPVTVRLPGHDVEARVTSDSAAVDWDAPSRFASLGARYGWWGLALLEAVLRLADIAVSEEYSRQPHERQPTASRAGAP